MKTVYKISTAKHIPCDGWNKFDNRQLWSLINKGYLHTGFKEIDPKKVLYNCTIGKVFVWFYADSVDGEFIGTELKTGARVSGSYKSLQDAIDIAYKQIISYKEVRVEALISRVFHGQAGVRIEPKDLFIYGTLR